MKSEVPTDSTDDGGTQSTMGDKRRWFVHFRGSRGYPECMTEMTVSHARARLADVVDAARVGHDPVYLTRRGQRVAAVIDADDLDRLIAAAEDLADIEAVRAARDEIAEGDPAIPWEQVKADLGLA